MTESELKFHIEEYKELRKEVLEKITKTETLIQYSVLIAAGVYSWLGTRELTLKTTAVSSKVSPVSDALLARLAWWIPFAFAVVLGLLGLVQYLRVKEMGRYLRVLESAMGNSSLGWERYLSTRPYTVSAVFVLTWLLILTGTGSVAYFVP